MNPDLKLRLKPLNKLTTPETKFLDFLCFNLGQEALLGCPGDETVSISFRPIEEDEDDSAYVIKKNSNYQVVIDNRMPFGMCVDFILHELAHCHSWHHNEENDHGPEWGKSFALLYTYYLELYEAFWNGT